MALTKFLLISALCACVALVNSKSFKIQPRIAGGNDATANQFPYSVGIFLEGLIISGGAIIGERHILTSAVAAEAGKENPNDFAVILGTPDDEESTVSMGIDRISVHPRFREKTLKSNLALFRTAEKIIFSEAIQPIALPKADLESDEGVLAVITGWGFKKQPENIFDFDLPTKLQYQTKKTMGYGNCVTAYANGLKNSEILSDVQRRFRTTDIICTSNDKGQGFCLGDHGSPLVVNGTLIGTASWNVDCESGLPDVYTKIYPHMKWIQEEMVGILEDDDNSDSE